MQTVLLVIHVILAAALIGTILIQRSEGGGLGMGRSDASLMTARGSANLLTRTTAILAALFFLTSITLAILAGSGHTNKPLFNPNAPVAAPGAPVAPGAAPGAAPAPAAPGPAAPTAPAAPAPANPAPAAPSAGPAPAAPTR